MRILILLGMILVMALCNWAWPETPPIDLFITGLLVLVLGNLALAEMREEK